MENAKQTRNYYHIKHFNIYSPKNGFYGDLAGPKRGREGGSFAVVNDATRVIFRGLDEDVASKPWLVIEPSRDFVGNLSSGELLVPPSLEEILGAWLVSF